MSSLIDSLYFRLPPRLQNIVVSAYGRSLAKKRYGHPFENILNSIKSAKSLSFDEIEEYKLTQLKKILIYSSENIPYYKKLFIDNSISPENFTSLKDIEKIPPLEKEYIRSNPSDFHPLDINKRTYFLQNTSGSSGKPMCIHVDEKTYKLAMALLLDHEQMHGLAVGQPIATFAGRMLQKVDNNTPPFWRYNKAENQMLFSAYHISEENFEAYRQQLNRLKPAEIIGYPSAIYSIAYLIIQLDLKLDFRPKAIVTNSETLLSWQRETIERAFECKIFDYYGTAEYVVFAGQCTHSSYHINPALGLLEVVDRKNVGLIGQEGDILCTSLSNYAMPLIRYRIGDVGTLSNSRCACNSNLQMLKSIRGRVDDMVITLDDKKIGRLDHIYKGLVGIKEAQIIQTASNKCVIKVVRANHNVPIEEELLIRNMKKRVGEEMHVEVSYVKEIEKGKNGKFKGVISELNPK